MEKIKKIELEKGIVYKPSRTATITVLENIRISDSNSPDDVRHLLLDMSKTGMKYYEGQSIGVVAPGEQENGRANKVRLYSVTSSRSGEDGKGEILALCVKREITNIDNQQIKGLCSNYICDLKKGEKILITGPIGRTFLMPQDETTNIIMFATGTGIAPYRGFMKYVQERGDWKGRLILFMGCKTEKEALYFNQQDDGLKKFSFLDYYLALSRVDKTKFGQKMYVQHRLEENIDNIWQIVENGNFVLYICGIKGIEKGIEDVFIKKAKQKKQNWLNLKEGFKKSGRWNLEVY